MVPIAAHSRPATLLHFSCTTQNIHCCCPASCRALARPDAAAVGKVESFTKEEEHLPPKLTGPVARSRNLDAAFVALLEAFWNTTGKCMEADGRGSRPSQAPRIAHSEPRLTDPPPWHGSSSTEFPQARAWWLWWCSCFPAQQRPESVVWYGHLCGSWIANGETTIGSISLS